MDSKTEKYLKARIRDVKDFPKPDIVFKDVTTLLKDSKAFSMAMDELIKFCKGKKIDVVAGVESRGFILGSVIAYELSKGFVPIRKSGKLPADILKEEYSLEYGTGIVEIHKDAIKKGQSVLIVDDVLATGGTASAAIRLVERLGGKISCILFLVELSSLKGREKLGYPVHSLLKYR